MIENIKRKQTEVGLGMAMMLAMWWLVGFSWLLDIKPVYMAIVGTSFLVMGIGAEIALDWYRNPAYSVMD